MRDDDRIGPEKWQALLGVGGSSSSGQMPKEKQTENACQRCGKAWHAHDKVRVSKGPNRYGYKYVCPR